MTDTTMRGADSVERAQHAADAGPAPVRRRQMLGVVLIDTWKNFPFMVRQGGKLGAEWRKFAGLGANSR